MPAELLGESCLLWRLGGGPSQANTQRVRWLCRRLRDEAGVRGWAVRDVVPAYDSLAVHFDPFVTDRRLLQDTMEAWLADPRQDDGLMPSAGQAGERVVLPTVYDGPDLQRVAQHTGLTPAQVVARHTTPVYTVAAIGFLPHFPYLLGLDPGLATPRLDAPRIRVPAGAVAIGNDQAGVYPCASPGGWNLIGTTDPELLKPLRHGDRVQFVEAQA